MPTNQDHIRTMEMTSNEYSTLSYSVAGAGLEPASPGYGPDEVAAPPTCMEDRITAYNANPKPCEFCGNPILAPAGKSVYFTLKKRFCSRSCVAKYGQSLRSDARANYNKNPKRCKNCDKPLFARPGHILYNERRRTFCNQSCSATFNNVFGRFPKREKLKRTCKDCGETFTGAYRARCQNCFEKWRGRRFNRSKAESTHRAIRDHAKYSVRNRPLVCVVCGYDKHAEVCHVKGLPTFPILHFSKRSIILITSYCYVQIATGNLIGV